jgi:RNA polymerase sigma-70 factor (ECF subfamily)
MSIPEAFTCEIFSMVSRRPRDARPSTPANAVDDPDRELLTLVQEYLRRRREGHAGRREFEAWERFYQIYNPLIRYYIVLNRLSLAEEDVRDCTQEVWKELIIRLPRFQTDPGRARFSTWLRILARNKAVDLVRRQRRASFDRCGDQVLASLASDQKDDPGALFEQAATQDELRGLLRDLARKLPRRTELILRLRWIEGCPIADIAAALGLSIPQVWTLNHRGLKRLRQLLTRSANAESRSLAT